MATSETPITLETVIPWAKSGRESDKLYRFLFLHPSDYFTIPTRRKWSIAHQVVFNGDVFLLRRILALYYDDNIQIRTPSNDGKTLLDVATDRQNDHPDMYDYVQQLFLRDDLIQAARKNKWSDVRTILEANPHLANEKPPYSTLFLLHYLVQSGDQKILEDLFRKFRLDTNVFSVDLETPLDLARRLGRQDMCNILEGTTKERSRSSLIRYRTTTPANVESAPSRLPYPKNDPSPSVDFGTTSISINQAGNYEVKRKSLFLRTNTSSQVTDRQTLALKEAIVPTTPVTQATESQLQQNFTCPLTQEIFVDPVIATDGQTYEREAIKEYIRMHKSSPMTGEKMETIFQDNTELTELIQKMRK